MDIDAKDLISSLPDALLCHVLSFLSTKDAALTSVLSRRWRYLLSFVPNLDLDNTWIYDRPNTEQLHICFMAFVDRILALQGNAPLNKFSLKFTSHSDQSPVNGWILSVLERGVVELDLFIDSQDSSPLPPKVFINKTLVSLKVASPVLISIQVGEVLLPKLKTLHFNGVIFRDRSGVAFAKMISSCHALEELVWIDGTWCLLESFSVSNPTLKRIRLHCNDIDDRPKSVSFDTPNLLYFEFTDTVAAKYPKASFDSLVEASIDIRMSFFPDIDLVNEGRSAADMLMGLCKLLRFAYESHLYFHVLNFCCKEAIPVFNNLTHLTVETHQREYWLWLPKLLENCRNLETLVFEGLHYRDTKQCFDKGYSFNDTNECFDGDKYLCKPCNCLCKPWNGTPIWLSSSPVKILKVLKYGEISKYKDDIERQENLIEHFLETMPNLEQVILYYDTQFDDDLKAVSTQLQMLKRVASTKCNIQVISDNISYSTTVSSSSSTNGPVFFNNTFPV